MSPIRRLNSFHYLALGSAVVLVTLGLLMARGARQATPTAQSLMMYCAAAMRPPVEAVAKEYEQRYGVPIRLHFGGSASLLSQIEITRTGDLYLAGDVSHIELAREKGLAQEQIPLAEMQPVIAVRKGNPKKIATIDDLLRTDVRVSLGDPDQAEIGRQTRRLLMQSGHWEKLKAHVTRKGVFKPTEPDVANDVRVGAVDAAIVWDFTAARSPQLETIQPDVLQRGKSLFTLSVLSDCENPPAALHFARYLSADDRGLATIRSMGLRAVEGDLWEEHPQLTFFSGGVNRRSLEPIVKRFAEREGVRVNTVFNGCGILTAQMRAMEKTRDAGFPDVYMACDVYYLDVVQEMFQDAVNVSNTDIVLALPKGNPKGIRTLDDLARPGVRVALGQPDKCTIGVLCQKLLESVGLYRKLIDDGNVVTQKPSSALLVPDVTTGAVDAALAYRTDTLAEQDKLEVIPIDSPLAKAVQPFSIARSSHRKYLGRRLLEMIARSRPDFEAAGFNWQLTGAAGSRQ